MSRKTQAFVSALNPYIGNISSMLSNYILKNAQDKKDADERQKQANIQLEKQKAYESWKQREEATRQAASNQRVSDLISGQKRVDVANPFLNTLIPYGKSMKPIEQQLKVPMMQEEKIAGLTSLNQDELNKYQDLYKTLYPKKEYQSFDNKLYEKNATTGELSKEPVMTEAPETTKTYTDDATKYWGKGYAGQKVKVTEKWKGDQKLSTDFSNPVSNERKNVANGSNLDKKLLGMSEAEKELYKKIELDQQTYDAALEVAKRHGSAQVPYWNNTDKIFEYKDWTLEKLKQVRIAQRQTAIQTAKNNIGNLNAYNKTYNETKYNIDGREEMPGWYTTNPRSRSNAQKIMVREVINDFKKGDIDAADLAWYESLIKEQFGTPDISLTEIIQGMNNAGR